ncbi:hypothetical protein EYC84_007188 [Monilinia fructicola]|uniref:Ubiquitin-like protease family profile domain-containing protein n=1 Tax=Monilinia fructicola TaxID=38448 RepID=A0A5M9K5U3_MONFR|nr:hypothetical protein EYC84_007188 [Monilinia fructicola]
MPPGGGFHPFGGRVSRHFGETLAPEDPYLSYYDCRLTREDVDTLRNDWLTDNMIAFWQEYLENEYLKKYPSSHIVLLRPSMAFMLMTQPNPLELRSALPDFTRTTHIFLPVNDNRNLTRAEGGSHWSLLLISVIDGVAFHYDSLGVSNVNEGHLTTDKMSRLLNRPLSFLNLTDSPQQENGSDCGVYVCIIMRHLLLKRLLSANAREKVSMKKRARGEDRTTKAAAPPPFQGITDFLHELIHELCMRMTFGNHQALRIIIGRRWDMERMNEMHERDTREMIACSSDSHSTRRHSLHFGKRMCLEKR